jgi:predicted dehydrogenase
MARKYVNDFSKPEMKSAKIEWNIKKSLSQVGWKQDLHKGGGVYRDHLCHAVDLLRNGFGFPNECFGSTLQQISGKRDLINHISLKSPKIQIEIHRDYYLDSRLKIEIESENERVHINTEYPFKLRNYTLKQNTNLIHFPSTINLDCDARRFALRNYISQLIIEESQADAFKNSLDFPSIEDAIFTQKIADRINPI